MEERAVSSQAPQDQVSGCLIPQDTYGAPGFASRRVALTALKFCLGSVTRTQRGRPALPHLHKLRQSNVWTFEFAAQTAHSVLQLTEPEGFLLSGLGAASVSLNYRQSQKSQHSL